MDYLGSLLMLWLEPLTLCGKNCTLEPLLHEHQDDLIEAVKDGELWNLWYAAIPKANEMHEEITKRLALQVAGEMLPFSVVDNKTRKVIGMTSYCRIDSTNKRLDIGFTWYAKSYQKTALNTEAKLMLLTHAFEELNCIAVGFRVDSLNRESQRAVERLGAKLEGVIRNYSVLPSGHARDMCFYSILPHEWPNVKVNLNYLLNKAR